MPIRGGGGVYLGMPYDKIDIPNLKWSVLVCLVLGAISGILDPVRAIAADKPFIELTTEELVPFSMLQGDEVTGISTAILREVFRRNGFDYSIKLIPWIRAYQTALSKSDACVFSATRTPDREALFKWVGPLVHDDWVVFALADSAIQARSIEDLRPYRTASTPGDAEAIYMMEHGLTVELSPTTEQLRMLVSKRIDFWATTKARGRFVAVAQGLHLRELLTLMPVDMFLACNPQVPDTIIDQLNKTLAQMAQDGATKEILASFGQ